jgi:hypothetical protein
VKKPTIVKAKNNFSQLYIDPLTDNPRLSKVGNILKVLVFALKVITIVVVIAAGVVILF